MFDSLDYRDETCCLKRISFSFPSLSALLNPLHQGAAVAACCIWGITCQGFTLGSHSHDMKHT